MDQSAIQRIQELSAAAAELPSTHVPAKVLPGDSHIHSLEEYLAAPLFMRQTFKTHRVDDFVRYVNVEAVPEETGLFISPDGDKATAIIDYGVHKTPKWGHHRAKLALQPTPAYEALLALCAEPVTQRGLIDWLEDWRDAIAPIMADDDGNEEIISLSKAIAKLRRINIKAKVESGHEEGNFRGSRTTMEEVEATSVDGDPPAYFDLSSALYEDTQVRDIRSRLALLSGAEKPMFQLRIMGHDYLKKAVATELEDRIRAGVNPGHGVRIFVGNV
ncbi:MAG: DUF2303 family protein [Salinisphaeraceae bacterium]